MPSKLFIVFMMLPRKLSGEVIIIKLKIFSAVTIGDNVNLLSLYSLTFSTLLVGKDTQ